MKYLIINCLFLGLSIEMSGGRRNNLPKGCKYYLGVPVRGGLRLDGIKCESAKLGNIPLDLPRYINYLEIRDDSIQKLVAFSFAQYPQLGHLSLRNNNIDHIDENTFTALTDLVYLDLSENHISELPPLPSSVETLRLDSMTKNWPLFGSPVTTERITPLKFSLKSLSLRSNNFRSLPEFTKEFKKLKSLLVNGNGIGHLTIDDIAPFCHLQEFDFTDNNITRVERYICDCFEVKKWARDRDLKIRGLVCPHYEHGIDTIVCNEKYGPDLTVRLPHYIDCRSVTLLWDYWFILHFGLLAPIMFVACRCWFHHQQKPFHHSGKYDEENIAEEELELTKISDCEAAD